MIIILKKEEPSELSYLLQEDHIATEDWVSDSNSSGSDTESDTNSESDFKLYKFENPIHYQT